MPDPNFPPATNDSNGTARLSPGRLATLACLMEVTAPKPGNVHRGADFEDVRFLDFVTSAVVVGGVFDDQIESALGELILSAVKATQAAVGTNTNLGLILLLAPLVKATRLATEGFMTSDEVKTILRQRTPQDGANVFRAIATANPGGMGKVESMDIYENQGDLDLLEAMRLAQDRDSIAAQYASNFTGIFQTGQDLIEISKRLFPNLEQAIVLTHVAWLAIQGDSLIARKCGPAINQQAQDRASTALETLGIDIDLWRRAFHESGSCNSIRNIDIQRDQNSIDQFWTQVGSLDFWLRSDGHRRNPGTTADLVGASLFVALYNRLVQLPVDSTR